MYALLNFSWLSYDDSKKHKTLGLLFMDSWIFLNFGSSLYINIFKKFYHVFNRDSPRTLLKPINAVQIQNFCLMFLKAHYLLSSFLVYIYDT